MSKVGYGNSHKGYYRKREKKERKKKRKEREKRKEKRKKKEKREKESLRAGSNSSKTITEERRGSNRDLSEVLRRRMGGKGLGEYQIVRGTTT